MKKVTKYILLILVYLFSIDISSQIIIDMAGDDNIYPSRYLSTGQYYIKDISNYLDNFIGTWEYTNGNEKFELILTKITQYHVVLYNADLDFYEDGLTYQYKKYVNNTLIYTSPADIYTYFGTEDGITLKGWIRDYGRITKTIYTPLTNEVFEQGGNPIAPICWITKQPNEVGEPPKIFFNLDLTGTTNYDRETYAGQPTFSIPNNVILEKVN